MNFEETYKWQDCFGDVNSVAYKPGSWIDASGTPLEIDSFTKPSRVNCLIQISVIYADRAIAKMKGSSIK